jgi:hypothetical protein
MATQTLPCGCVRGSYLCNTAETLWRNSMAAYCSGDDATGDMWRNVYEKHFEQQSPEFQSPVIERTEY